MKREIWVLKVALSRLPEKRKVALFSLLPEWVVKEWETLPTPSDEIASFSFFSSIHWSWFLPLLERYTKEEQKLFLAIFPQQVRNRLNQEIGLPPMPPVQLKKVVKEFIEKEFVKQMGPHILPPSYLPSSPLNALLKLNKKELIALIDLVALFDLMVELKQIVETKILRKIYSFLSEEEKKFLKTMAPTNPPSSVRWEGWNGTKESFRHVLHKRGLKKLGFAVSEESSDLSWYLSRILDVGRGTILLKAKTTKIPEDIREEIHFQIHQVLSWQEKASQ